MAFDFLKIDGVIVQNVVRNPAELGRARTIAAVCRKVGVRTIAEFVEDDATRARLSEIGVDYVQGFGVARPEHLHAERIARVVDAGQFEKSAA
jgi:EAL domain-containing protein (putative c-di-GMP-specific phosphodiesterase class I)